MKPDKNLIALEINMSNEAQANKDPLPKAFRYAPNDGARLVGIKKPVNNWKEFSKTPLENQIYLKRGIYALAKHSEGISFIIRSGDENGWFTDNHGIRFCISCGSIIPL